MKGNSSVEAANFFKQDLFDCHLLIASKFFALPIFFDYVFEDEGGEVDL